MIASSKFEATMASSRSISSVLNCPRHSSIMRPSSLSPSPPFSYTTSWSTHRNDNNTASCKHVAHDGNYKTTDTPKMEEEQVTHNDSTDVLVALVEILDDFLEVAAEQFLVREQLLLGGELANVLLPRLVALTHNGHRVVVFLTVEYHIEASLVELAH